MRYRVFSLMTCFSVMLSIDANATPTDDFMYDSEEGKSALQCLLKADEERLNRNQPFSGKFFSEMCQAKVDIYKRTMGANADEQINKMLDYFRWQDKIHNIQ